MLQFRPVEAITRDSEVTCGGPDVPCTDELLLNDSGITLRGPDPETYGVVSFELGDLLITGEDVAVASITETNMGDEELQGTDWSLNLQLTDEAASTYASATARAASEHPPLNQIAMVVDGMIVVSATVIEPIEGGQFQVSSLSREEAASLAERFGLMPP